MIKFCDNCLEDVSCVYDEGILIENIDGFDISYLEKYYVCDICGEKFYDDLSDYNTTTAHNALKQAVIVDNLNNINELMDKYSLGKKPLSLILNMGEVTIPRYFAGSTPTREHAELIRTVNKYPLLMEMYLRYNRDKLTSVAYKKALEKVKQIRLSQEIDKCFFYSIYILSRLVDVTPKCLQRLLFFYNCISLVKLDNSSFIDFEVSEYGLFYFDIQECFSYFKVYDINYYELLKNVEIDLNDCEKNLLDEIIDSFGCYSGSMLYEMICLINSTNNLISESSIREYFTTVLNDYDTIEDYAESLFKEVKSMRMED